MSVTDPTDPPSPETSSSVVLWYPTSIINCRCDPEAVTLIVVTGFGNASECGKCHKLYRNVGVKVTDEKGVQNAMLLTDVTVPISRMGIQ